MGWPGALGVGGTSISTGRDGRARGKGDSINLAISRLPKKEQLTHHTPLAIPFPPGMEVAIFEREVFRGPSTSTCAWGSYPVIEAISGNARPFWVLLENHLVRNKGL